MVPGTKQMLYLPMEGNIEFVQNLCSTFRSTTHDPKSIGTIELKDFLKTLMIATTCNLFSFSSPLNSIVFLTYSVLIENNQQAYGRKMALALILGYFYSIGSFITWWNLK